MRKIMIGADYFPPYQYIDEKGEIQGSDYNFIKSIFDKMNYEFEFVLGDWNAIEKKFINGEIDVVFQVQKTKEREKTSYFSDKIRDAKTGIITNSKKMSNEIQKIEDILKKKKILAVIEGYNYGDIIDSIDKKYKKAYKNDKGLINHLNSSEDGFAVFDIGVFNSLKDTINKKLYIIEGLGFTRELFVMFKEKDIRDEFNKWINSVSM